jgi:hypothetical protein
VANLIRMRLLGFLLLAITGSLVAASAPPPRVTVSIGAGALGEEIPADFVGLSFETSNLIKGPDGRYIFAPENENLVRLFRTIGIKNLRIGGGTAEISNYPIPGPAEIDRFFAFAREADVRVIYTLRLLKGDRAQAAALARHLAEHHSDRLDYLSIGNEPDWHSYHIKDPAIAETTPGTPGSAYPSFLAKWREFASAVTAAVPDAKFGGPDTGSNYPVPRALNTEVAGKSWTEQFVIDERQSPALAIAFHHDYIGQEGEGVSVPTAVDAMLSRDWPAKNYPALYDHVLAPVRALGKPYRMTECNDHTGGVDGASNAFVSALWALDYMHWQALHGARGVNFHNKRWIYTCTIVRDAAGVFHMNPKGYGLKAFNLGSHGRREPVTIENPRQLNLTAYSVRGANERCVTLINKEHGAAASAAEVALVLPERILRAQVMLLTAHDGQPTARTGITLGGSAIGDNGSWSGKWTPLPPSGDGTCHLTIPATSAAVVWLTLRP